MNSETIAEFFKEEAREFGNEVNFTTRPEVLLTGERPLPLIHLAPRTVKGTKWWNQKRQEVYASTNYHCLACGCHREHNGRRFVDEPLHAHELYIIDWATKTMFLGEIVPLCAYCHNFLHQHGMGIRFDKGINTEQDCWESVTQGLRVCGQDIDNINERETYEDEWHKWKFIYEGKTYWSKYTGYEDWKEKEMP